MEEFTDEEQIQLLDLCITYNEDKLAVNEAEMITLLAELQTAVMPMINYLKSHQYETVPIKGNTLLLLMSYIQILGSHYICPVTLDDIDTKAPSRIT